MEEQKLAPPTTRARVIIPISDADNDPHSKHGVWNRTPDAARPPGMERDASTSLPKRRFRLLEDPPWLLKGYAWEDQSSYSDRVIAAAEVPHT